MSEEPFKAQTNSKIASLISESTQFLSQYMKDLDSYERREDVAMAFLRGINPEDVKPPSEVYRPFSDFHPL